MRPNTKMSSGQATFDLKAARQMCAELPGRDKLPLPDRIDREERVLRLFPAALDEIERLQADIITHDDAWHNDRAANAKRIAELVSENENLREWGISNASDAASEKVRTEKQLAALKVLGKRSGKRGKALVEERAKRLVSNKAECGYRTPIKNRLIFKCDKGIICDWDQCPIKDEWREEAREQLRREGKI